MTRDEQVAAIEKERRERESAALLFLLALSNRTRQNVNKAIRTGGNWRRQVRSTLLGDESLDLAGGIGALSRIMADSHAAGVRTTGRLVGVDVVPANTIQQLRELYRDAARSVLERIAGNLEDAIEKALGEAAPADSILADVQAAGGAFKVTGMVEDASRAAEAEATAVVTVAYGMGMDEGFRNPDVVAVLTGLVFINPLDNRTTPICRQRHNTILPLDHPWWFVNWPPLHFGCRSVVLPLTRPVVFTPDPPTVPPPDPGWGRWSELLSNPLPVLQS